jgi:hypothetical protein
MLKLPPPVWALIYVLLAAAISWQLGWPAMPGFPLPKLGIALTLTARIATRAIRCISDWCW